MGVCVLLWKTVFSTKKLKKRLFVPLKNKQMKEQACFNSGTVVANLPTIVAISYYWSQLLVISVTKCYS